MKKTILSALFLATCWQGHAQLDFVSQAMLRRAEMAQQLQTPATKAKLHPKAKQAPALKAMLPSATQPMLAMVQLNEGATADQLTADGFNVQPLRGGFAVVTCSTTEARRLAQHPTVKKCEFNRQR
ncbi:MAG: hypothetical protein HUK02_06255, partial [Bacteroidaceae bacterium]|nr:hypothetical protein [Bacteroidaceae bacterium]